ncbi:MAG TPA: response regulator [Opitutaceae bacterium]|nr:response regulator [Opitutaceae bacterium]
MTPSPYLLVAEDDDDDFFLLTRELSKAGLKSVARTADGKATLEYLRGTGPYRDRAKHPFPDVLFLDLKLPLMLGHEVLQEIRKEPKWKALKVYVLTGSDEHRDRERIDALGCDGYYVKPLGAAQLAQIFPRR